ncbi:hypothetical protein P7K49_010435 [Saguinus oedipus]|uniref:Uncharacterized protein n=1 Tax=Saguinus oedipus TaxID=9490 RepID=A0ABQ9VMU1_SAGOE|nr:hypothetical protein P7K49_010435 [Saguinus oedipus]
MAWHGQPWSRLDPQEERDLRKLIWSVAGLQEETDPNFQLALNFVWSNLRRAAQRGAGQGGGGAAQGIAAPDGEVAGRLARAGHGAEVDEAPGTPRRPCRPPLDADQALLIVSG